MKRKRLPHPNRDSETHRVTIKGFKVYFTVGLYDDGTPGELFVHNIEDTEGRINDGGAMLGWAESWAIAVSMLLQSGWTVDELEKKFGHVRFEPSGFTDSRLVRGEASSIVDYIIRWIKERYGSHEG